MSRLVLLDRDGVLNRDLPRGVCRPEDFHMIPGAAEAVARLSVTDVRVAVVTNQSGIHRGLLDWPTLERIHDDLRRAVDRAGGHIDEIIVCADPPERPSPRRKPAPGMILEALAQFGAEAPDTPMIGDALRDLEAAAAAGCPRMLVRTGKGQATEVEGLPPHVQPVTIHDDLAAAVDAILSEAR